MEKTLFSVEFQTKDQQYMYDCMTSRIINVDNKLKYMIRNFFNKNSEYSYMREKYNLSQKEYKNIRQYAEVLISKYNMFYHENEEYTINYELSKEDIEEMTYNSPLSQLILIVTNNCNLRCEYCVYSEKYPKEIGYSKSNMDFKTAKLAIDQFFKIHKERKKRGLRKEAHISFYGGEPLLNFELIKKSIEYVKKIDSSTIFYITTNGTIMNDEIAEFLTTNNIMLTFSLDGYKDNHDRNRVYVNNKKSFDIILNNIEKLQSTKRKLNTERAISFNCCFDSYTDLDKVVSFFEEHYYDFNPFFITFAQIKPYDTTYYQWCDEQYNAGNLKLEKDRLKISREIVEKKLFDESISTREYRKIAASIFLGELTFYIRNKSGTSSILRNSCMPLSKMAVTTEGKIVLCEKMCEKFPVGDVDSGINWKNVSDVSNKMIKFFNSKKCSTCKARALCDACFMFLEEDGNINNQFCERKIELFEKELKHHSTLYERGTDILSVIEENKDKVLSMKGVSNNEIF